ncbi:glycosyltransferase [Candidatus Peregrinibacteria bacterium]|nr:glycosyltransferase [Candidatus Peregrinibacteria bacterium]
MKLLIITQKVDRADPILGFFHHWVEEFSKNFEKVTVIGQFVGEYELPANVHVYSLGKERGKSLIGQVFSFQFSVFKLRREYDAVFVHMTPIWIVLGAPVWILLRKRMYLWYEARGTRWPLRVAVLFVRKVFSASVSGMPIETSKSVITGHGIDTTVFVPTANPRIQKILLTAGRVSRSKRLECIFRLLRGISDEYALMVCGEPITRDDVAYEKELEDLLIRENLRPRVVIRPCTQVGVRSLLQVARVFLHASTTALDKAVLEAMACGCPVVSTNPAVHGVLPKECCATDENFLEKVQRVLDLSDSEQRKLGEALRQRVVQEHDVQKLIKTLITEMMQ